MTPPNDGHAEAGSATSAGLVPAERLRVVLDGMFDGVWMVDPAGRTTYANTAMAVLFALSRTDMLDRSLNDFLDASLWPEADAFLERQRTTSGERIEFEFIRADGRELLGMLAGSPIRTPDGTFAGTMLNFSDVTGKRAFAAQLAQNVKMQAMGEFAGSLAHDFNNMLTALRGHVELAQFQLPEVSPIRADLDQALLSADRAGAITRKLLAFTSRQVLEPVLLDPGQLITDLMPMLSPLLGNDIDVILHIQPRHSWVRIDRVQFEQTIVNLVVNAHDAMPDGGTLTISVHDVEQPRSERPESQGGDGAVRITVADTGHGMDAATVGRAFDPFFTTKPLGKGTGLGLATVFGIVTQSGGRIDVESAPNEGACFLIDLPGVAAPVAAAVEHTALETPVGGTGVVLLIEDEPGVRDFARRVLEAAGYRVLSSPGGKEALRASARWGERIEVVLSDVVLNDMRGPEIVALLRAQRPDIRVVYVSGYAQDIVDLDDPSAYDAFVPKPFSARVLTGAVSRVLAGAGPERPAVASLISAQDQRDRAPGAGEVRSEKGVRAV